MFKSGSPVVEEFFQPPIKHSSAVNSAGRKYRIPFPSRPNAFSELRPFPRVCSSSVVSSSVLRCVYLNGGSLHFRLGQDKGGLCQVVHIEVCARHLDWE